MADIGRILFVVNLVIAGLISVMGPILAVERFQQNYSVWFAVMYSMFQAGMLWAIWPYFSNGIQNA